ncbi:hypothetical protein [Burkholderia vietnamiensis]|uniref:hypothetical protein n=1 Tax=Burkholderia vietnamiensis TaxID=60552 RepID=UPI001CF38B4A|nr:hypothetical protein [Burkholderia vietnamiensis]MCA8180698.1 hypothetical protein [Burkholderia vietnamiensis]
MSKRTALQLKEPNHDDPKVARLTSVIARKHRVHGVNASGERVAYEWDGVTGEWRRDWEYGSTGPVCRWRSGTAQIRRRAVDVMQ